MFFVQVRAANTSARDISAYFSPPLSRTSDIPKFLRDLQVNFFIFLPLKHKFYFYIKLEKAFKAIYYLFSFYYIAHPKFICSQQS